MKFNSIDLKTVVKAEFVREDKDSLQIYSSMAGAKEVEDAFFTGLTVSLQSAKTVDLHLKSAADNAEKAASRFGKKLMDYGFYDSEPREVMYRIKEQLLGESHEFY